jgi:hypothetical protein
MLDIDPHESVMSPVVRHKFPPASAPHVHTSWPPYWQRL